MNRLETQLPIDAPVGLRVIRHETGHVVGGYTVLGEETVRGVTVLRAGKVLGCANFDLPMDPAKDTALAAADCAIPLLMALRLEPGGLGLNADEDYTRVAKLAYIAYRRLASPGDDADEWTDAWLAQVKLRVEAMLNESIVWKRIHAVERALDSQPVLSGDGLRAVLSKVPREVK